MHWYIKVIRNYVNFNGRATRPEFWFFMLINLVVGLGIGMVEYSLGAGAKGGLLSGLYNLFIFLPSTAVVVRRLHDIGRSGWWALLVLLPLVGVIAILVMMAFPSQGDNEYGARIEEAH